MGGQKVEKVHILLRCFVTMERYSSRGTAFALLIHVIIS